MQKQRRLLLPLDDYEAKPFGSLSCSHKTWGKAGARSRRDNKHRRSLDVDSHISSGKTLLSQIQQQTHLPGLRRWRTGGLMVWKKSGEAQAWGQVLSFNGQWWFRVPSHLLVLVQSLPGHLRALHDSLCWKALQNTDLISHQEFTCFTVYGSTVTEQTDLT